MEGSGSNPYNVTRISRLVDMYHTLHSSMARPDTQIHTELDTSDTPRLFSCPLCKKRMWRSIETFRMHKINCGPAETPLPSCADCGAKFCSSPQYKAHLDSPDQATTHVCPLHCGLAFSTPSCLDHHVVHCFASQQMGPYTGVRWRGRGREVVEQILDVAADSGF